jgi:hypothetical protein
LPRTLSCGSTSFCLAVSEYQASVGSLT